MNTRKVVLVIMDGWGISPPDKFNAIDNANTPTMDMLTEKYPNLVAKSDGLSVGLPPGQFGTSEVNHLTIGSGRVIFQDLPKINQSIENGQFYDNAVLNDLIGHVTNNQSNLHLTGILSDGGVHSHIEHLFAIFELLRKKGFQRPTLLHLFADGRDVAPKSFQKYLDMLNHKISEYSELNIQIATIQGRTLLDRDRDWDKTAQAVDLITAASGIEFANPQEVFDEDYALIETDEYMKRFRNNAYSGINPGDAMFISHYRTDRIFQLISSLYGLSIDNLLIGSFVRPSDEFTELLVAFPREEVNGTLAEAISSSGKRQMHVAETEKYPHVTYFFNGEKEEVYPNEEWKSYESYRFVKPKYNFDPAMQNGEVTKAVITSIIEGVDFILVNMASTDMVGHTGNYNAAVVSAECVDYCVGKIYEVIQERLDEYILIVTADHGNSDQMWDYENDQPHTQHTTAPVPVVLVNNQNITLKNRDSLADLAPTILDVMGVERPHQMTGESLIEPHSN